mmetsp:Transcript_40217/g.64408  ORF Transcript_40217/g.64408 Transcript_40217/m.64408 type:complete len:98 (+) Transcript_40217:244-537(+)
MDYMQHIGGGVCQCRRQKIQNGETCLNSLPTLAHHLCNLEYRRGDTNIYIHLANNSETNFNYPRAVSCLPLASFFYSLIFMRRLLVAVPGSWYWGTQ